MSNIWQTEDKNWKYWKKKDTETSRGKYEHCSLSVKI
jgi:hypothetical protein